MVITTEILIERLKEISPDGFEVSLKFGMLSRTKAVYFHECLIYIFNMEDDFIFAPQFGYTEEEFLKEHKNYSWKIDMTIS